MLSMMRGALSKVFLVGALGCAGCTDKAKDNYGTCIQLDAAGDIGGAWKACSDAVGDDPNSTSGIAAAAKLATMKPAWTKWKADQDAKAAAAAEQQRQAAAAQAKAEAQAQAQQLATLRAKMTLAPSGEDDQCVSNGKPPWGLRITGGSYDENEQVATARGCVRAHPYYPAQGHTPMDNYYCCPR
jgi:hypothetical protein